MKCLKLTSGSRYIFTKDELESLKILMRTIVYSNTNLKIDLKLTETENTIVLHDAGARNEDVMVADWVAREGKDDFDIGFTFADVEIDEKLHYNDSPAKINLWGRCLSRAKKIGSRCALSWLTRDDFRETGADESDTEGLVNMLTHMSGTNMTVLVSEVKDCLRCSVRARGSASAQELAARHGGGGHQYAAGCKLYMPLKDGLALLEEELKSV